MQKSIIAITLAASLFGLAGTANAQSARDVRGPSPYEDNLKNQGPPRLIVDPPLPGPLAFGVFQAQYRVENIRIVPVFGAKGLDISPRIGHLHVIVDDGPFWWADASDSNTVDVANLAPGPHKITIQLVDSNHNVIPGQVTTLNFVVPPSAKVAPVIR